MTIEHSNFLIIMLAFSALSCYVNECQPSSVHNSVASAQSFTIAALPKRRYMTANLFGHKLEVTRQMSYNKLSLFLIACHSKCYLHVGTEVVPRIERFLNNLHKFRNSEKLEEEQEKMELE